MSECCLDRLPHCLRLCGDGAAEDGELVAGTIELVKEREDHGQRLLADGAIAAQLGNEADAGDVELVEEEVAVAPRRPNPAAFDPGDELSTLERDAFEKIGESDHGCTMWRRGSMG